LTSSCQILPFFVARDRPRPGLSRASPRPHTKALGTRLTIDGSELTVAVSCTIRDGPLDIWGGGGGGGGGLGNFSVHEFFFIPQLLARIFFSATFLCTIFFLRWPKKIFPEKFVDGGGGGGGGGRILFWYLPPPLKYLMVRPLCAWGTYLMRSRQGDKGCDPCQQAIRTNRPLQRAIS
jgi:hypothetical protein